MNTDAIVKHIRNKNRQIVHIHLDKQEGGYVVGHIPKNVQVQFEFFRFENGQPLPDAKNAAHGTSISRE